MIPDDHPNASRLVRPGQLAPDFTLPDTDGQRYRLATAARRGPVALVFYRGDW